MLTDDNDHDEAVLGCGGILVLGFLVWVVIYVLVFR